MSTTADPFIPFHVPSIGEEEIREVEETLRSGWLTTGPKTARFENDFRAYVCSRFTVAVSSATAGLHLAMAGLGVGPGDEVITTPLTFCSTVHTIVQAGATPVLADVGRDGNIDPGQIERKITHRTRAILPVHLAGLPCDMNAIWAIARRHRLSVIEDAAHAAGARYNGRPIGAGPVEEPGEDLGASDAVVFSFYATKNLTTGEGGMIATPHESLAQSMRVLSLHGMSLDGWGRYGKHGTWFYEVIAGGFKYNLSDIQSAIGIHQLQKLEGFIERRARYAAIYNRAFSGIDELELPPTSPNCRHAWHLYILRLKLDHLRIDRDEFIRELRKRGVGTSVHFIPIPLHPYFQKFSLDGAECPNAFNLYRRIVSLPLYPAMDEEQVHRVVDSVREVVAAARKRQAWVLRRAIG